MAIVLNTTVGSKSANSMVTVAEADTFITGSESPYPVTTFWSELTTAQKNFRLYYAAKRMCNYYSWLGVPLHVNQAMPHPRYTPSAKWKKGAWPGAEEWGGFVYGGSFYPVAGWETVLQFDELTEEQLEALDFIPEDIKRVQSYLACIFHRGLVGVTDPADGPKDEDQIKSLKLFDALDLQLADKPVQPVNSTTFDRITKSEHFIITELLAGYVSTISWGYGTETVPPLAEVA